MTGMPARALSASCSERKVKPSLPGIIRSRTMTHGASPPRRSCERVVAVLRRHRLDAVVLQEQDERLHRVRIIVDQQHRAGHRSSPSFTMLFPASPAAGTQTPGAG